MQNEKISVIIPVYNVVQYLEKSVNSVISQDYPNMEIILVDDGSNDGSEILCDTLSEQDKRIRTIHTKNQGPALARNQGLNAVDGKYIYFMDSDDYLKPGLFKAIVPFMNKGYEMVVFNYQKVDINGKTLSYSNFKEATYDLTLLDDKIRFIIQEVFKYHVGWELWNRIYQRDIIEKNHIRFVNENYAEDLFFLLCYLGCINKIYCIRLNLYNYLIHPDSLMAASKKDQPGNLDKVNNLSYALDIFYKSIQPFSNITHFYPAIHFNFLKQHINALYELGWSSKDICKFIRSELYNSQFCLNEFRLFVKHSKEYYFMLGKSSVLEDKRILKYYSDANWMKFRIESKIFDLYKKIRDGVRHIGNSNYNIL